MKTITFLLCGFIVLVTIDTCYSADKQTSTDDKELLKPDVQQGLVESEMDGDFEKRWGSPPPRRCGCHRYNGKRHCQWTNCVLGRNECNFVKFTCKPLPQCGCTGTNWWNGRCTWTMCIAGNAVCNWFTCIPLAIKKKKEVKKVPKKKKEVKKVPIKPKQKECGCKIMNTCRRGKCFEHRVCVTKNCIKKKKTTNNKSSGGMGKKCCTFVNDKLKCDDKCLKTEQENARKNRKPIVVTTPPPGTKCWYKSFRVCDKKGKCHFVNKIQNCPRAIKTTTPRPLTYKKKLLYCDKKYLCKKIPHCVYWRLELNGPWKAVACPLKEKCQEKCYYSNVAT